MLKQAKIFNRGPFDTSTQAMGIKNNLFFKLAKNLAKIYAKNAIT